MFSAPAESRELLGLTSQATIFSGHPAEKAARYPDLSNDRAIERTAPSAGVLDPGLTQRLECDPYKVEVGGSNPSARTNHPYRELTLTRGYVALVSPEDYGIVVTHKWTAMPCKSGLVYARRTVRDADGTCHTILLHRFILGITGPIKIDHHDGDGLNCRRYNLRLATTLQNNCNRIGPGSKHGFTGVESQTPGTYRGRVILRRKSHYTKTFPSAIMAAIARDFLALELHGEFAVLNFPILLKGAPLCPPMQAQPIHA